MPKNGWLKFVALGCFHCPLQDKAAVDWALARIEEEKPDILVHLGDGHEADAASRWPSEYDWTLQDEFGEHDNLLKRLRQAAPKSARRIFLPGNHDANLQEWNRIDKRLRGLCDYRQHEPELEHWEQPAQYVYHHLRGVWRLGQVTFAHGYSAGANSDEEHTITLGVPYGLYIGAHTHRPTPCVMRARKTATIPLPYWYANSGCMREMSPPYIQRKRHYMWGQACVIGELSPVKSPRMSRQWTARVETFRISGDEEVA